MGKVFRDQLGSKARQYTEQERVTTTTGSEGRMSWGCS